MPDLIKFFINGKAVTAKEDESIWEVSKARVILFLIYVIVINQVTKQTAIVDLV